MICTPNLRKLGGRVFFNECPFLYINDILGKQIYLLRIYCFISPSFFMESEWLIDGNVAFWDAFLLIKKETN